MNDKEPYRATRLWNEVIAAFQSGMPLKKHRHRIYTYSDCFTAAEAVTWLHCYLINNSNFGPNVTRIQTINLLQKFLKCHVIESVTAKSKKKEFLDDSHLYKFTSVSFHHSKPSALCLLQSPTVHKSNLGKKKSSQVTSVSTPNFQKENLPECHFVERKISPVEIKSIWEKVTLTRLEALLPHVTFTDLLDEKYIDGHLIKHNVTRLSKTGVVCLVDKTDDIPHWVVSAMKCLATWPNASGSGSCLPNYPGFEKDVFKVVRDFFINPQVPLLPEYLTPFLLTIFGHFVQDQSSEVSCFYTPPTASELSKCSRASRQSSRSRVKTSTPLANDSIYSKSSYHLQDVSEGNLLLDDPEVMWEYPSAVYFETDFGTSQPITRVISNQCTPRSRSISSASSLGSVESVSTISVCSMGQRSLEMQDGLCNHKTSLKAWCSNLYLQDEVKEGPQWLKATERFSCLDISAPASSEMCENPDVYVCEINDLNTSDLSSKTMTESTENVNEASSDSCHAFCAMQSKYSSPLNQSVIRCNNLNEKFESKYIKENIYSDDLKSSFQLILLLLPSANRRQLHLLLRLINKILKNGKFIVDDSTSMRVFLLKTFLPAIVQSEDVSILRLSQVAAFLLDYCEALFQPPPGLKEEVAEICRHSSGRIRYTVDDTCLLTYCEMVSKQQYEDQKLSASSQALKNLLSGIIYDRNMSDKERKKKLKQFKNSHPDIYALQFPEKEQGTKQKNSFFNKLVNLRM